MDGTRRAAWVLSRVVWAATVALDAVLLGIGLVFLLGLTSGKQATATPQASGKQTTPAAQTRAGQGATIRPGGTWVRSGLTLQVDALLQDPQWPHRLYAGTTDGVWLSTDAGVTWRRDGRDLAGTEVFALAAPAGPGPILAGAANGAVYASVNSGQPGEDWRRVSPFLGNNPIFGSNPIFSLAIAPTDGHVALAGTVGALYRGVDGAGGWTWQRVARTDDASITSIVWAPWTKGLAFASVFGVSPAVLATHDGGYTWRPDTGGLPATLPTETLIAVEARQGPRIILSTMGEGVWQRSAAGTWHDISAGLPQHHAMPLLAALEGTRLLLYAGTMGEGVYIMGGNAPWRRFGRGLDTGAAYTALSLAVTPGPHPVLLAGTARGVFRYVPPT